MLDLVCAGSSSYPYLSLCDISYETAILNAEGAFVESVNDFEVVGGEDNSGAEGVDLLDEFDDVPGVFVVEVAGGLISDEDARLAGDGTSDGDALLFAAG